jgi:polyhydroxyalkanoate synthesis regulator phasin
MVTQEPGSRDDRLRSMAREGFTLMVGAASWAFEQGERLMDAWMEQGRASRTEGRRRFDAMTASTRDGIRNWTAAMPVASREQVLSLERRIEELTRQVEELRASAGAPEPRE